VCIGGVIQEKCPFIIWAKDVHVKTSNRLTTFCVNKTSDHPKKSLPLYWAFEIPL
jgi:hypothetical protein